MSNKMHHVSIIGGGKKEKRSNMDFYPTPPEVTQAILNFLNLPAKSIIREPACGDGSMSVVMEGAGYCVVSSDIRDTGFGKGGVDFLFPTPKERTDAVITNPPFSHAEEFIREALKCAPVVAMVLKCQFFHAAKRIDLFTQYPPSDILCLTWRPDFDGRGNPTLDCIVAIWKKGTTQTLYHQIKKP